MSIDMVGSAHAYQPLFTPSQATHEAVGGASAPVRQGGAASVDHSAQDLHDAVETANKHMEAQSAAVRFNVTQESGRAVVRMVDMQTKQVLLQIPNLQMVNIAQNLDKTQGLAIQRQA